MQQKALGYVINTSLRFYRYPEKSSFLRKIKIYTIWATDFSSDCFIETIFDSDKAKETAFLLHCLLDGVNIYQL